MFGFLLRIIKRSRDRRRERRAQLRAKATFGDIKGAIVDLSLGGCGFYPHDEGLEMEARALLTIDFGTDVITLPAKIVSVDSEGLIYGVAFEQVSEENFEILNEVLVSRIADSEEGEDRSRTEGL